MLSTIKYEEATVTSHKIKNNLLQMKKQNFPNCKNKEKTHPLRHSVGLSVYCTSC
ncbi:hypothetical protein EXN66_Car015844 [Channa argus]|uniref:Uncharacterized protein n=1 Tax=Channa argus TaxID=215402 RepID=A0A6G1QCF0_CHAAH|nr:hypothetical protein EXN66_Car015844 [Channa argus]